MEFIIYSRAGCHLCEEMERDLAALLGTRNIPVRVVDVDSDPQLRRRYGLRVPVLMADGEEVCSARVLPGRVKSLLGAAN